MVRHCFQTATVEIHRRQVLLKCRSHATGIGDTGGICFAVQLTETSRKCQLRGQQVLGENV